MSEPVTKMLAGWRESYTGRRTVPEQMVRELESIVETAFWVQRSNHEDELRRVRQECHEDLRKELAKKRSEITRLQGLCDSRRETIETQQKTLEAYQAPLKEKRKLDEDTVRITIDQRLGGWEVGDLEDIAYRLRSGGATDHTPIDWQTSAIHCNVPAPNLVPLHRPGSVQPIQVRTPEFDEVGGFIRKGSLKEVAWSRVVVVSVLVIAFIIGLAGLIVGVQ